MGDFVLSDPPKALLSGEAISDPVVNIREEGDSQLLVAAAVGSLVGVDEVGANLVVGDLLG